MRGLLYVHHCLSEGELEEATLSSLRGLVSYRPLAHCRVEVVVEEVVVVGVRVNFDRFSVVAPVAVEVGRARRRRQVGEAHLSERSHGPARLDAEPRAILEATATTRTIEKRVGAIVGILCGVNSAQS